MDHYYNEDLNIMNNIENLYEDYDSLSSPDFSKYRKPKKTYDMKIVRKLIDYVEKTLNARLSAIGDLIKTNNISLEEAKQIYSKTESRVVEIKARANVGKNLISDEIKFFFDLVQGKPQISDSHHYQEEQEGYYRNEKSVKTKRKSSVNLRKKKRSKSKIRNKENQNPNQKRRFFVGGSKATFEEHMKDRVRSRTPVHQRDNSRYKKRRESRGRISPPQRKKYYDSGYSRNVSIKNEQNLGYNSKKTTISKSRKQSRRNSVAKEKGSYLRQSNVMNNRRSTSKRKQKRWEQLYNMALEKENNRRERSKSANNSSFRKIPSRDSISTYENQNSRNLSRKNSLRSSYTFMNHQPQESIKSEIGSRKSRKNLALPPQPKSSAHSRKHTGDISLISYNSPNDLITQTMPQYKNQDTPSPSLFKNKTDELDYYDDDNEEYFEPDKTLKRMGNQYDSSRLQDTLYKGDFSPERDERKINTKKAPKNQMPELKTGLTKDDIFNLLMDPNLTEQEKKVLLQQEFKTLLKLSNIQQVPRPQKSEEEQSFHEENDLSADTRLLLTDYNLNENMSRNITERNYDSPKITPKVEIKEKKKIETIDTEEKKKVLKNFEVLNESFGDEVEYIKNQNKAVDKSLKENKLIGNVIDIGEFKMSELLKSTEIEKKAKRANMAKNIKMKKPVKQTIQKKGKESLKEKKEKEKMLKNIEALERAIELGVSMNNLGQLNPNKRENADKENYISFKNSDHNSENLLLTFSQNERKNGNNLEIDNLLQNNQISNFKKLRDEALQSKIFL